MKKRTVEFWENRRERLFRATKKSIVGLIISISILIVCWFYSPIVFFVLVGLPGVVLFLIAFNLVLLLECKFRLKRMKRDL